MIAKKKIMVFNLELEPPRVFNMELLPLRTTTRDIAEEDFYASGDLKVRDQITKIKYFCSVENKRVRFYSQTDARLFNYLVL